MKAIVWTKYGPPDGLELREVPKPSPKGNEVLIKIHATTVTAGDCEMRSLKLSPLLSLLFRTYAGLRRPKRIPILGQELAGEIEAVGDEVKRRKEGDRVFAATGLRFGAYAEYACLPGDAVMALKPANMSYGEAATVPMGGLNALHFLRKAGIRGRERVLINGAGGSIGTMAVQLAKSFDAEVTAVDTTRKLDMLRAIGADHAIDYTREDFTRAGVTYDAIFDIVGKSSFSHSMRCLRDRGTYLLGNARLARSLRGRWSSTMTGKRVVTGTASYRAEDLAYLKELIEAGRIKAVIDRRFPLDQIADAHRYVETGEKTGSVVITVGHADAS